MKKDEIKQLKKDFDAYIQEIEQARGGNIYQKEVGHLARKFLLDRFDLTQVEELLKRHVYRQQHTFAPKPKPTLTEQQTRLCEIAAGLKQIGQLEMRLVVMVQKAIADECRWDTIDKLLHHLFRGADYDKAIGYLRDLYLYPTKRQPVLCLVSNEPCTGKTSFLHLLRFIFKEKMCILHSESISSKFNSSWAGKLIIGVDELFIDTDNSRLANQLKTIASSPTICVESKGLEKKEIPNFSKLVLCSNAGSIGEMDLFENAWIVQTTSFYPQDRDCHMAEHIEAEIPAFISHLITLNP